MNKYTKDIEFYFKSGFVSIFKIKTYTMKIGIDLKLLVEKLGKISHCKFILKENESIVEVQKLKGDVEEIERYFSDHASKVYPDGSIDYEGDIDLSNMNLSKIPIKFNKVAGYFVCHNNNLTTLENCPKIVSRSFFCNDNQLITLRGCPVEVGMTFSCKSNKLTSLEGCPKKVGGNFYCHRNLRKFKIDEVKKYCDVKGIVTV